MPHRRPAPGAPRTPGHRAVVCALLVVACGGGGTTGPSTPPPPPPPPMPTTLAITQGPGPGVEVGDVVQLAAETRDEDGQLMGGRSYSWASSAPAVATVSGTGRVTARSPGTTTISVATGSLTAELSLTVGPATVTAVAVFPTSLALRPAESKGFVATALGRNGMIPGAPVTWASADEGVVSVDQAGQVTAVGLGITTVTATSGGVSLSRGVTVSEATDNLWIARLDFIQIAQTPEGTVPLVAGKPTAVRLFPGAAEAGHVDLPIRLTVRRGGAVLYQVTVPSGEVPTAPDHTAVDQGIFVPLPTTLDLNGATVAAVIDPDNAIDESDEWDNAADPPGEEPAVAMTTIAPVRIRLVRLAPEGTTPSSFTAGEGNFALQFLKLLYPASQLDVSIRGGPVITSFQWTDQAEVSRALNQLEIERLADGFVGHYYGVMPFSSIAGLAGLGQIGGYSALGNMDPGVIAHEIGHNMGLRHVPGCGAGNPTPNYPYPDGQVGTRGWDPRSNQVVPAFYYDVMGYCRTLATTWISGNYYQSIYSVLLGRTPPATLRAPGPEVVAVAVTGRLSGAGHSLDDVRVVDRANMVSDDGGAVTVEFLDAADRVAFRWRLPRRALGDADGGEAGYAGIVPVPPAAWAATVRVRVASPGVASAFRAR